MKNSIVKVRQIVLVLLLSYVYVVQATDSFPRLYVNDSDRGRIAIKVENVAWAKTAYERLRKEVDPYVERHVKDKDWIVSRLAMYWKDGERYTQCYLKKQNWDYGEGNAPVPTVRMPGMRTWNKYYNVPLEDRIPYNETGDMLGIDKTNPQLPSVLVPYKESGHMIRYNNEEILKLAEKAAFIYWLTQDEKYASFASDIFQTWLLGTYYMNPIKDPEKSTKGYGGWEPGGICGYYDYEQIHDNLGSHAAVIYDFARNYMVKHQYSHLKEIGRSLDDVTDEVLKRFVRLGMIRGGKLGNWNVNGWNVIVRPILMLKSNEEYSDGKGREYYLHYLLKESTEWRASMPEMLDYYDKITGLWPESPGYAFGTVNSILQWHVMLQRNGIDILADNSVMEKASLAVIPWMDSRGNMIVFGDTRGGSPYYETFENLLPYYRSKGDDTKVKKLEAALLSGIESGNYNRSNATWEGICTYVNDLQNNIAVSPERTSYSKTHKMITMKNGEDENQLMALIYGGTKGSHLVQNGLAIQLYSRGYAVVPDAAAYESYWSKDYAYHQTSTGTNTILPGYTHGDISFVAMEPCPASDSYTAENGLTPYLNFADIKASEKRRVLVMLKTNESNGYYVDIFRSNQMENDYIFHNAAVGLTLKDSRANNLRTERVSKLDKVHSTGYSWFEDFKRAKTDKTYIAEWNFPNNFYSRLWMPSATKREVYSMMAPPSTFNKGLTIEDCSLAPNQTPTLLVRQDGINGKDHPFVGVFETYDKGENIIEDVRNVSSDNGSVCVEVTSIGGRKDTFVSADEKKSCKAGNFMLDGVFAHSAKVNNEIVSLYLGNGLSVSCGGYKIESAGAKSVYAAIYKENGIWKYSASDDIKINNGSKTVSLKKGYNQNVKF